MAIIPVKITLWSTPAHSFSVDNSGGKKLKILEILPVQSLAAICVHPPPFPDSGDDIPEAA